MIAYTATLLQVDPRTLGVNLWLIIAALILLTGVGLIAIATWTGIRTWITIVRQRSSHEEYMRSFHRADGGNYPPATHGKCEQCGVQQGKIFHVDSGPSLCPGCYEAYWRRETGWMDESTS